MNESGIGAQPRTQHTAQEHPGLEKVLYYLRLGMRDSIDLVADNKSAQEDWERFERLFLGISRIRILS